MDPSSGESSIPGDELGKRFALQLHVEQAPTSVPLPKGEEAQMMHKAAVKMSDQYQTANAGHAAKKKRAKAKKAKAKPVSKAEEAAKMMAKAKAKAGEAARNAKAEEAARVAKAEDEDCAIEGARCYAELFASKFRDIWYKYIARDPGDTFEQTIPIPAKRYTHCAPDDVYSFTPAETLMITSVKLASINDCLHWPLQVFGIVAARDVLDRKRNIIFHRTRDNCQSITQDDPYLALTGPSRSIVVSVDPSYIEVSLKVKGTVESQDKDLSELVMVYRSALAGLCGPYPSRLSTLEFQFSHIDLSVEATIYVKVTGGSWPDGFRGVFSAGTSYNDLKVKLLDFRDDGLPVDDEGMIKLSRRVVSVGLERDLIVSVMACPVNKEQVVESSEAAFLPETAGSGVSQGIGLNVGSCSMEVTVAWSLFKY